MVIADLLTLQDLGRERLIAAGAGKVETMRHRYGAIDHAGAKEIAAWINGDYAITNEIVQTQ